MHPIALRFAIESGRVTAIRKAMKTIPVCAYVAYMGGEACRKVVTFALSRLLPSFKACVRAYTQYDTHMMRSCILTVARARASTLEQHRWVNKQLSQNDVPYLSLSPSSIHRFNQLLEEKSACNL